MFFENQSNQNKEQYEQFLKVAWCLSNLFSDSEVPYLYYRVAEKVFCRSFQAEDLSRSDVSSDAKKWLVGIWLKTFLIWNNKTFQKVAEFNNDRKTYSDLSNIDLVRKVSELRNIRIDFTEKTHWLESSLYHCIVRDSWVFKVFEEPMHKVDVDNIRNVKNTWSSIVFNDGISEYSFLLSKSTLTKRFITNTFIHQFSIDILENPLEELDKLFSLDKRLIFEKDKRIKQTIYLPLYSKWQKVFEKSWLNSRNASQEKRKRDYNEVYIHIPVDIHNNFPHFFPDRETPFDLKLPNWDIMQSKVCQDGWKALMSYSNKELWKRILRDVLWLEEGELLTYEKLQILGIDSVRIDKISSSLFEINFSKIWSYERFMNLNQ